MDGSQIYISSLLRVAADDLEHREAVKVVKMGKYLLVALLLLGMVDLLQTTLSKTEKSKKKTQKKKTPTEFYDEEILFMDILNSHSTVDYGEGKKFPNPVLGYVTPWNSHGYDVAKALASKFTIISPVWLQMRAYHGGDYGISGFHDVDQGWITDVRRNNSEIKIFPRMLFDSWSAADYERLYMLESDQDKVSKLITNFIRANQVDGVVLEIWVQSQSATMGRSTTELIHFLRLLAEDLHHHQKEIVVVVPPPLSHDTEPHTMFVPDHFAALAPHIDLFSVMTYDHPSHRAGPVSPITWVKNCMEMLAAVDKVNAKKLLMGINFYGYDYHPASSKAEAIIGPSYINVLTKHQPEITWDKRSAEHYLNYDKGHVIFFPSLWSIDHRLTLAKQLGVGVAIWEIGQGLDYFYNLF